MLQQEANPLVARPWISDYASELTGDYDGPVEAVIRHLDREAGPGEVILVQYEHYPFMFYTELDVVRWDEAATLQRLPDWIFLHGLRRGPMDARIRGSLHRYQRVPLTARELRFENIPEPYWHRFRTRRDGPAVKLYRLREGGDSPSDR
jgi:hypothetical protein